MARYVCELKVSISWQNHTFGKIANYYEDYILSVS